MKLEVYLHLMGASHPIYSEMLSYPPENITYAHKPLEGYYNRPQKTSVLKKALKALYSPFPAVYYVRDTGKSKVIHSTNSLMLLNNKPWVVDSEQAGSFLRFREGFYRSSLHKRVVKSLLRRESCKAILPWSDAALASIDNYLRDEKISKKMEVIPPAVHLFEKPASKPKDSFRFLFVGRVFFEKGGRELLEAFSKVRSKHDCSLTWVGPVPKQYKEKYQKGITYLKPTFGRKEMEELLSKHHALVLPTYIDTFGFLLLEAMSAGLPVVSTSTFCIPEIVKDGETGLLVEPPVKWYDERFLFDLDRFPSWNHLVKHISGTPFPRFASSLAEKMSLLCSDSSLWASLSARARKEIAEGRFSIKVRNKAIGQSYLSAASDHSR